MSAVETLHRAHEALRASVVAPPTSKSTFADASLGTAVPSHIREQEAQWRECRSLYRGALGEIALLMQRLESSAPSSPHTAGTTSPSSGTLFSTVLPGQDLQYQAFTRLCGCWVQQQCPPAPHASPATPFGWFTALDIRNSQPNPFNISVEHMGKLLQHFVGDQGLIERSYAYIETPSRRGAHVYRPTLAGLITMAKLQMQRADLQADELTAALPRFELIRDRFEDARRAYDELRRNLVRQEFGTQLPRYPLSVAEIAMLAQAHQDSIAAMRDIMQRGTAIFGVLPTAEDLQPLMVCCAVYAHQIIDPARRPRDHLGVEPATGLMTAKEIVRSARTDIKSWGSSHDAQAASRRLTTWVRVGLLEKRSLRYVQGFRPTLTGMQLFIQTMKSLPSPEAGPTP